MSRRARPARPLAPMAAAVMIIGLWWLVAHNAGSGWVQVLGDLVFGALLIGIAGPYLAVGGPGSGCAVRPGTASPARRWRCGSTPRRGCASAPSSLRGPRSSSARAGGGAPLDDTVTLVPDRRGVHGTVTLDVATAAPFALQWWTKRVELALPSPLLVSPRCGRPQPPRLMPDEGAGELVDRPRSDAGLPRGARPYAPGDSRRLVHWRATAHAGKLMVRELERPSAEPVTITVELPADPDAAELVAEGALGTVVGLLEGGAPVLLGTRETAGPVLAAVTDRRGAGRRLARAVAGPGAPAAAPRAPARRERRRRHPAGQPARGSRGLRPAAGRLPGRSAGGHGRLRLPG